MFGAKLNYEQNVFINNTKVIGINELNSGYDIPEQAITGIGKGYRFSAINGPQNAYIAINRFFVGEDFFYNFTGKNDKFSGIIQDKKTLESMFAFEDAYLTSHSVSVQIGQIPSISTSAIITGNLGKSLQANLTGEDVNIDDPKIPNQGSVEIICGGHDYRKFNRILNFNLDINVNRHLIYGINESFPIEVHTLSPIETNIDFSLEVDDIEIPALKEYFSKKKMKDLSIRLYDSHEYISGTKTLIQEYLIDGAKLLNHSIRTNSSGSLEYNMTYKAYRNV
jgi:hypothetical protein